MQNYRMSFFLNANVCLLQVRQFEQIFSPNIFGRVSESLVKNYFFAIVYEENPSPILIFNFLGNLCGAKVKLLMQIRKTAEPGICRKVILFPF